MMCLMVTKADQARAEEEARKKHDEWEKESDKSGATIHLPRSETTAPDEGKKPKK